MNPLTNVKNLQKLNEKELNLGIAGQDSKSWHQKYKDSAWIFVGGLPYDLSEGDVISIFSQYGEIVNINLVRDRKTGKSRGFCFICFEDQRSTILSVDNLNATKVLGRTLRVDHVEEYKVPKERGDEDEIVKRLHIEGCAPKSEKRSIFEEPAAPSYKKQTIKTEPAVLKKSKDKPLECKIDVPDKKSEKVIKDESRNSESRDRRTDKHLDSNITKIKNHNQQPSNYKIDRDAFVPSRYKS